MSKEQVTDDVEGELQKLLTTGQTRGNTRADISLQKGKNKFRPVLHQSVTYIVAAVLFNERGEVLMTQEGFFPVRGQWYLPAGRVDPNEDLQAAVVREVREETGMEFVPKALLHVEIPNGNWVRFTFTGDITGGRLRTLAERDGETMQGGWWPVEKILEAANNLDREFQLRGKDIVKLILSGRERHELGAAGVMKSILPQPVRHDSLIMRLLLISCHGDEVAVLVHHNKARQTVLPTVDYCPSDMKPRDVVLHLIQTAVGSVQRVIWRGLAATEHTGLSRGIDDGHCLTQVIAVQTSENKPNPFYTRSRDFSWKVFSEGDIKAALMKALDNKVYPSLTF